MKHELFNLALCEFAKAIDESLLPQTTISSLGLKLAVKAYPEFKLLLKSHSDPTNIEVFASALRYFMLSEFNYESIIANASNDCIRLVVKKCPFQEHDSPSLCSVMHGIVGGLTLMSLGYCKLATLSGPERAPKPCYIDLFTSPTPEAKKQAGFEYSKETISLLQKPDDESVALQRQSRRKIALGLFGSIALSLHDQPTEEVIGNKYIEALSCVQEIRAAALYLKEFNTGRFVLTSHFGLPDDILPAIRTIGIKDDSSDDNNESLLEIVERFDIHQQAIMRRTGIRLFTSIRLKTPDKIIGVLNIGWKTRFSTSFEMQNAITDSCMLIAALIDNCRLHLELKETHFRLEKAYIDAITLINNLINALDQCLERYSKRVAELAEAIAVKLNLPQGEINRLYQAAFLHDIGKVNIPPEILSKSSQLTEEEYKIIKTHPIVGAELLAPIPAFQSIIPAVLYHHERLDGSGYPEGLAGSDIPLHARIIAVADSFDAMTSDRPYRKGMSKETAISELVKDSGAKYDTAVVKALLEVLKEQEAKGDRTPAECYSNNRQALITTHR